MRKSKIEYWQGNDGLWYWHLRSVNGEIQFVSEGYTRRASVLRAIEAARTAMAQAVVVPRVSAA